MPQHTGACDYHCGHMLSTGHVKASPSIQLALDKDPRVVEWDLIDDGSVFEYVYAPYRPAAKIYLATAEQLGIKDLASGSSRG